MQENGGSWPSIKDPQHASQAVTVWQDVVLEHVHAAVNESQRAMVLEFQLKSIVEAQSQIITSTETLKQTRTELAGWQADWAQSLSGFAAGRYRALAIVAPHCTKQPGSQLEPAARRLSRLHKLPFTTI